MTLNSFVIRIGLLIGAVSTIASRNNEKALSSNTEFDITTKQNRSFREEIRNAAINRLAISKLDRVHEEYIHEVNFVIKQKNIDELERQLHLVSDPSSPSYLKFWTSDQIGNLCGNKEGRDTLMKYLAINGVTDISETPNGEIITARSKMMVWESMFQTEFYHFEHTISARYSNRKTKNSNKKHSFIRAESYEIPNEIKHAVASVLGITQVPFYKRSRSILSQSQPIRHGLDHQITLDSTSNSNIDINRRKLFNGKVTPDTLRYVYNIPSGLTGSINATQCIFSTNEDSMSPADLEYFQKTYTPAFVQPVTLALGVVLDDAYCAIDLLNCGT